MSYLFGDADRDLTATPQPGEQTHLPTTFADTFGAEWSNGERIIQGYIGEHDRFEALQDHIDNIKQRTGVDVGRDLDWGDTSGIGVLPSSQQMLEQVNGKLAKLKQDNPTIDVQSMTPDELSDNGIAKRRKADADFAEIMGRERGPGATLGAITGGITTATVGDPINDMLLPIAPAESAGIVASFLKWGAMGVAGQAISTALQAPYREQVQPGYILSGQPLIDVAQAGLEVGAGGAAIRGLAMAVPSIVRGVAGEWDRIMGRPDIPESVRQAGNVVASQANVLATNTYPGPEGDAAHAAALVKTNNDIFAGRPVDVSKQIPPEVEATRHLALAPGLSAQQIEAARLQAQTTAAAAAQARAAIPTAAQPELPFERTAAEAQAEAAKQTLVSNVQQMARRASAPYDMPAEEAARVADKLTQATPAEAQDLLSDLHMSPRQVADAPTRIEPPAEPVPMKVTPIPEGGTPELHDAMRADLNRELVQTAADYRAAGFTPEEAQALAAEHVRPYQFGAAAADGAKAELQNLIEQKAPRETLINHPFVQDTLRRARELEHTGTAEELINPKWRANRVYDFDGVPVRGFDNALDPLAARFERAAGPEGVAHDRHVVFVTGPPASGKSTFAVPLARELRAAIPDPDDAKEIIPEYQNGLGSLAVHNESSRLAREATAGRLAVRGDNLVIPTVGKDPEALQKLIQSFKDAGYTVDLMHVSAGAEVASRRNIQRIINTGRVVEPEYLLDAAEKTGPTAYMMRGRGLIHDFADIDTSGQTPIVRGGEGPIAEMVRSGRYLGERPDGGHERIFGEAEGLRSPGAIAAGGVAPERAAPGAAPEEIIPNLPEAMTLAQGLREVDAYKAVAEQIGACAAAPVAEAA